MTCRRCHGRRWVFDPVNRSSVPCAECEYRDRLQREGLDPGKPSRTPDAGDLLPFEAPLARATDPATSHQAAEAIAGDLSKLQALVLEAFHRYGEMTARRAERLPEFEAYGFSTIRKRVSELHRAGRLLAVGTERRATIYAPRRKAAKRATSCG